MKQFRNNYPSRSIFSSFGGPAEAGSPMRDNRLSSGKDQHQRGYYHKEEEVKHSRQTESHVMGLSGQRQGYGSQMTPRASDAMTRDRSGDKLLPNDIRIRANGYIPS